MVGWGFTFLVYVYKRLTGIHNKRSMFLTAAADSGEFGVTLVFHRNYVDHPLSQLVMVELETDLFI